MGRKNEAEVDDTVEVEAEVEAPKMKKKVNGVTQEAAITILVESNPKRSGSASYDRFEGYLADPAPTTVKEALDNGLTMGDIHYDFIHGSIEVAGAEVVEYEPTARGPRLATEEGEEVETESEDGDDNF